MISKTDFVSIELKGAEIAGAWKSECATSKCQDLIFKLIWRIVIQMSLIVFGMLHPSKSCTRMLRSYLDRVAICQKGSIEDFWFDLQQECCTTS